MTDRGCEGCMFREYDGRGCICSLTDDYLSQMDECPLEEEGYRMPCPDDSVISVAPPVSVQNGEGGEKGMASEWEELERLSKDELIIELVKARRAMRNICLVLKELSEDGASHFMYDTGEKPSDAWFEKIVSYAESKLDDDDGLDGSDLERYGVDGKTANEYCYDGEW